MLHLPFLWLILYLSLWVGGLLWKLTHQPNEATQRTFCCLLLVACCSAQIILFAFAQNWFLSLSVKFDLYNKVFLNFELTFFLSGNIIFTFVRLWLSLCLTLVEIQKYIWPANKFFLLVNSIWSANKQLRVDWSQAGPRNATRPYLG